jgi:hypothetical protein
MPCAVIAADKLPQRAITANEKVRGDFQPSDALKVGVCVPIELVGEQALHGIAAVLAGRQADGVENDQVNADPRRAWTEIR